jgi:prephenate dehydrogenase
MMLDILRTNRTAVVEAVRRTRHEMDALETLLSWDPEEELAKRLAEAARRRKLLLATDGGGGR